MYHGHHHGRSGTDTSGGKSVGGMDRTSGGKNIGGMDSSGGKHVRGTDTSGRKKIGGMDTSGGNRAGRRVTGHTCSRKWNVLETILPLKLTKIEPVSEFSATNFCQYVLVVVVTQCSTKFLVCHVSSAIPVAP